MVMGIQGPQVRLLQKEHSKAIACETSKTSSCSLKHKIEPNSNIQNAPEADLDLHIYEFLMS
jgi:hypothetical protein